MRSNLNNQLQAHIDNALECSAIGIPYRTDARELSSKYYVVVLETYWGGLLPERYRDPQWLSAQAIDDQKRFWGVYFHCGAELAVKTICKVTGKTIERGRKPLNPQAETLTERCFKKMERLDLDGLTLAEVRQLFPRVSETIVREGLLTICAHRTWSAVKSDNVYFSKARGA